jgi:hypothetical protein
MRSVFVAVLVPILVFVVFVGIFLMLPPICRISPRTLAVVGVVVVPLVSCGVPRRDRVVIAVGQSQKIEIVGGVWCVGTVGVCPRSGLLRNARLAEVGIATSTPIHGRMTLKWLILAELIRERIGPAYQPCQLRQCVHSRIPALGRAFIRRMRLIPKIAPALIGHVRLNLTSGAVEDTIGHLVLVHPVSTFPAFARGIGRGTATRELSHLIGRADSKHGEPRTKHRHDALHERKAGQGKFWIILDNEA